MDDVKQSPIGLMPRSIWVVQRIYTIVAACYRFKEANEQIPDKWVNELIEHLTYLEEANHNYYVDLGSLLSKKEGELEE